VSASAQRSATPAQQRAVAARGNVLVVASAGTGKTRTLVERCLRLMQEERSSLDEMLIVTFTEAAATEMRRRIGFELRKALTETSADAERAEWLARQLALLDTAHICTLHSFCLHLVRQHFAELGIDPEVTVLDDRQLQPLIQQTLETIFERHYGGASPQSAAVRDLVRQYGRGADAPVRALVLKLHRYAHSLAQAAAWLTEQETRYQEAEPTAWRTWFEEGFQSWRDEWREDLRALAAVPAVDACLTALEACPPRPSPDQVGATAAALLAADQDKSAWPRGSRGTIRQELKKFFEEAAFWRSLTRPSPHRPDAAEPLAEDWLWLRPPMLALLRLTREFTAEFSRAKRALGGVDFADLEQFALQLLRHPDTLEPTRIGRAWQARFRHLFVDEYQDINGAQDAILTALSQAGTEANRFLVGDVKQSIYRFRLANPAIFRDYEARWGGLPASETEAPSGQRIPLADNFRSREAILQFVNALFRELMRPALGGVAYAPDVELQFGNAAARHALSLAAHEGPAEGGPRSRVELHWLAPLEDDSPATRAEDDEPSAVANVPDLETVEREALVVAQRLQQLQVEQHPVWDAETNAPRPVEWRDMVVLLRSPAGRQEAFAKAFHQLGVPLAAARGGFFDAPEVSDLLQLLRLLDNPRQDIPLLAVLRSPLVALSLAELAGIRAHSEERPFWIALRRWHQAGPRDAGAGGNADTWANVDLFLSQFQRWRALIRQTSLTTCLETVLAETHYDVLLAAAERGEERVANLRRLLDLARQYDPWQRQGLYRFLHFVDAAREADVDLEPALPQSANAVRLLSIHRSKGLEFPIVVVAGLGTRFNFQDLRGDILLHERYGLAAKVIPPGHPASYPSLAHWLARRAEHRELLGEELRLLYVALTRARDTLLLVATWPRQEPPDWRELPATDLSDRRLLSARSALDWLAYWLARATTPAEWSSDTRGANALLQWFVHRGGAEVGENAAGVGEPAEARSTSNPKSAATGIETVGAGLSHARLGDSDLFRSSEFGGRRSGWTDASQFDRVRHILEWNYPFARATTEPAKASVSALRRRFQTGDDEARPLFQTERPVPTPARSARPEASRARPDALPAADRGTAHHLFLQNVSLERVQSELALRNEAERLRRSGTLNDAEAAALDYKALLAFWGSDVGRRIVEHRACVQREMPFTVRVAPEDLERLGLCANATDLAGEFTVVQGRVDLAVLLPRELWLLDFKTDHVTLRDLPDKTKAYAPQVGLYALALQRIHARRVTHGWLHFLALGQTVAISPR
jgi:ATP-dependent helicase/nuclease subunit A